MNKTIIVLGLVFLTMISIVSAVNVESGIVLSPGKTYA